MYKTLTTIAAIASLACGAGAQTATPAARSGLGGLLGGALGGGLGGGLPDLGAAGAGNVAGVLGYCIRNNLLGGAGAGAGGLLGGVGGLLSRGAIPGNAATGNATPQIATPAPLASGVATPTGAAASGAQSVLQRLLGQRGVKASPGFAAGQTGRLQAGNQALSIGGQVKTRMCAMVLDRAKAFL